MATNASAPYAAAQFRSSYFYVWSALACAAVAFLGFVPTYFAPLARGSFSASPIVHIHGIVFFSWTLFFTYQTWLVANGRTMRHRDVGLIGISFATAMTFLGLLVAVASAARAGSLGFLSEAKQFMVVPVAGITTFAVLFAFAIANVTHKEVHKRLMLVATASILDAGIARLFFTFLAPPLAPGSAPVPPVGPTLPAASRKRTLRVGRRHRSQGHHSWATQFSCSLSPGNLDASTCLLISFAILSNWSAHSRVQGIWK